MTTASPHEVTQMLIDWSNGNQSALDKLMPLVDQELHRLAHHYMRRENPGHTLQTTALVNEAYLRLLDQKHVHWKNRAHFFALSAQLMRRYLWITRAAGNTQNVVEAPRGSHLTKRWLSLTKEALT